MLKGFKVIGKDGGFLEFYETEDKTTFKVTIDYGDSKSVIRIDKDSADDVANLTYKLDVDYPAKDEEGGNDGAHK